MLAAQAARVDSAPPVIKAIEIERANVFGVDETNNFLLRLANKLHATTRAWVIRREVLLRPGERWDSARVAESARNLRGLGVFRRVEIDSVRTDSGMVLRVRTGDAWSTRVEPRFSGAGNQRVYAIALGEVNLAGTASEVRLRYDKRPDRDLYTALFRRPRLIGQKIGVLTQYQLRSDGHSIYGSIGEPYFTLKSQSAWNVSAEDRDIRVLRFFNGNTKTAGDSLQQRFAHVTATVGKALFANDHGYLRVGLLGQIRRENFAGRARLDTIGRSVFGVVGVYGQWRRARFQVRRGFQGFSRDEDVDLSTIVQAGVNLTPRAFGYQQDGFVPSVSARVGLEIPHGFITLNAAALARITDAGWVDTGSVHVGGTLALLPSKRQIAVFHAAAGWQRHPEPGAEFDLGLGIGPRAFDQHSFTGDRAFFLSAEYRYQIKEEFLRNAGVALAAFTDYGGAWYAGSPRRTGFDYGVGLRFGLTRTTGPETTRIDFARLAGSDIERSRWRLVIGRGFAFSLNGRLDGQ
ncbi:MAG: BamA/TamA family outer membrane protein [Gemmatimonadota bacterium]